MKNTPTAPARTPTGWWYEEFIDDITGTEPFIIREAREPAGSGGVVRAVATVMLSDSREDAEAKAAFIVRACNAHPALLDACRDAKRRLADAGDDTDRLMAARWEAIDILDAALSKVAA
jgi:hypothetical protein